MKSFNIVFDNPNQDNNALIDEFANAIAESMAKLENEFVFVYEKTSKHLKTVGVDELEKTKV